MARSLNGRAGALAASALTLVLVGTSACDGGRGSDGAAAQRGEDPAQEEPTLAWAEVLQAEPDPTVVTDEGLCAQLRATGLPWRVRARSSGIELLLVPPGECLRGAPAEDPEATADERPQHTIRVAEPFYLGRYEVTQDEWRAVLGDAPSFFAAPAGDPAGDNTPRRYPVEQVALFRVQEFLAEAGLELPTESQWEYACRAGEPAPRHGPPDAVAWHHGNARGRPHAVGLLAANSLGFHDLLGNVWEWTSSGFLPDEYGRHRSALDARTRALGTPKAVLRGGSWYDPAKRARASARYSVERDFVGGHVGFRALRAP